MSELAEIVLPHGQTYVTVRDVPSLIAAALYPERKAEPVVSYIRKATTEFSRDVELTTADWAYLQRVWRDLPPFEEGMPKSAWLIYEATFNAAADRPEWCLVAFQKNGPLGVAVLKKNAEHRHAATLRKAILDGELTTRSHAMTLLSPFEGGVPNARIPIEDLTRYVRQFRIQVRAERPSEVARPEQNQPEQALQGPSQHAPSRWIIGELALERARQVVEADANDSGTLRTNACIEADIRAAIVETQILADVQYLTDQKAIAPRVDLLGTRAATKCSIDPAWWLTRADLEHVLQYIRLDENSKREYLMHVVGYRRTGRYTLRQAADYIEAEGAEDYGAILQRLSAAACSDELSMYAPGRKQRHDYGPKPRRTSCVRDFYEEAYWNDLNAWLAACEPRIECRFPDPGINVAGDKIHGVATPAMSQSRKRSDLLDPKIDAAIQEAGSLDPASVFPILRNMALQEEEPFNGLGAQGLKWTNAAGNVRHLNSKALGQRLKGRQFGRPVKAR